MKVTTALVVLFVFLFGCFQQTYGQNYQFTANCQVGNSSKPSAGLAACQFSYSWSQQSMLDSEGQNALLYVFNQWYGENLQLADPFVNQWEFKSGPGCPGGCSTGRAMFSMPRLWINSNYTLASAQPDPSVTYGGQPCYHFTANAAASRSNVTNIWFTTSTQQSSTNICRFDFSSGTYYLFSNVNNNPSFASNTFTSPSGCTCSKPIDIALVLDRSGSISVGEFQQELTFLHGFYNSFTFSTAKTMMGIVNFNTQAWGQYVPQNGNTAAYYSNPPALALSASPQAINATINGLSCCTGNTGSDQVCCNGFTAIGSGMIGGANILKQSTRKANAAQMIVMITDGKQNTLYHPNSNAYDDCYYYDWTNKVYLCCQYAIGSNCPDNILLGTSLQYPGAQYLQCLGDANYDGIVDAWQVGQQKPQDWPCTGSSPTQCNSKADQAQKGGANCNGTYCSSASQYQLGRLAICHQDLIDSREYAYVANPNTYIYAVGVGNAVSTTELNIITNNLYKRPANVAPVYPVNKAWTPVYNAADNTNPERVLAVSDWNALSGYLQQIASQICDAPATPCGDCCGNCECGQCTCPTQCAQPANKCQQYVIPTGGCCCTLQNVTCPPQPCMNAFCDPAQGCIYTPRNCGSNGCYNFSCNATTNACYPSAQLWKPADNACFTSGCDTTTMQPYNNVPVTPACSTQNTACVTYSCANATGLCVSTPTTPTSPEPANKCQVRSCDPVKGWSTTNDTCTPLSPCYNSTCTVETTQCFTTGCNQTDGSCFNNTIICTAKPCYVSAGCDNVLGCQLAPKDCNDNNACTTDTCDNDVCIHTPITCNGTDLCQVYSCDPSSGCQTIPRNCDDGINCTTDSCDSNLGCLHVTSDSYCNDDNLCTNDTCSATEDCQHVHIECEWDGNDCDEPVCRANYGCQNDQIVCYLNGSGDPIRAINYYTAAYNNWTDAMRDNATAQQNQVIQQASDDLRNSNNCNFAVCSNNTCVLKQLACAAFDVTAVIAGAVTAGAIAGIVIAVIAALALGGGGAYYVAQSQSSDAAANVQTNPMYAQAGNGGDNPLHEAGI